MKTLWSLVPLCALILVACAEKAPPPAEPSAVYEVRGMVRKLPKQPKAGAEVRILHEEITDFRTETGEVVGMESMAMPFPVADAGLLEGVEVGDRVNFTFEVRWETDGYPLLLTELAKLPEATRLTFELPSDAGSEEPPADGDAPQPDASEESETPDRSETETTGG